MQKTLVAAAFAAVIGFGGAASAADVYSSGGGYKDAPFVPVTTWTGFYIGVGGGYGSVNHDIKLDTYYTGAELNGLGGEGGFGTVEGGFDYQIAPKWVIGVFANYDFGDIETKRSVDSSSVTIKLTDSWAVGGRLGYLLHPTTLAYFLGGYTEASFDAPSGIKNKDFSGYVVGAGVQTTLGGGFYGKLEYRYADYDANTIYSYSSRYYSYNSRSNYNSFAITDEPSVQTIRATIGYKLGSGPTLLEPLK
jgi:outer membrane immunogenic protein